MPDGDEKPVPEARDSRARNVAPPDEDSWTAGEALATSAFWLIISAEMITILTSGTIGFQVAPYLVDSGMSQPLAALAVTLSSALGAIVNPGWGLLADKYQPRLLAVAATLMAMLSGGLFVISGAAYAIFFFAIIWGMASGGLNVLGSMMLAQYFGRASYGTITGLAGPFQMVFLGLGPTFGALLYAWTNGYDVIWIYAIASYAVAAVLIFGARKPTRKPTRP